MGKYIACICEGGFERAVLDLLLDNEKLIFKKQDLIEEEVLRCRSASEFERKHLRKSFQDKITVYRVLDSRREEFTLSKQYKNKVEVVNVITAPEIEMLIIFNEKCYEDYHRKKRKNPQLKPSIYCKSELGYKDVKSYEFVINYFSDIDILIDALREYRRVSNIQRSEESLYDLLNEEAKK